jgi:hypothetical protein
MEYMTEEEELAFADKLFYMQENGGVFTAEQITRYGEEKWGTMSMAMAMERLVEKTEKVEKAEGAGDEDEVEGPVRDSAILGARLARVQPSQNGNPGDQDDHNDDNESRSRSSDRKATSLTGPNAASLSTPTQLSSSHPLPPSSALSKHCPHLPPSLLSVLNCKTCAQGDPHDEHKMSGTNPTERK